ncbi:MAG: DUF3095 domain-containing protein [Ruegeria sp.]|uniref:DUF3095 domain-containing protein n=1 Tax=Ruegeria sp. TaxID=1879320 RepID=UPI00349E93CB
MFDRHDPFYAQLVPQREFARMAEPSRFQPVPDDWMVGVSDIVNSTGEIAEGRYKTVNMVGAAVISAMINALGDQQFPYIFGGDGASFAVPGDQAGQTRQVLATLRRWAEEEFAISLRAALVPVRDIRSAGLDVRVARFAASEGVDYAMFAGRGLAWAETRMKAGEYGIDPDAPGAQPDLTGLSCRWSNARAQNGQILSLVVLPTDRATERDFADLAQRVVAASEGLARGGHPVPAEGPAVNWPPPGLDLDAHVSRAGRNLMLHKLFLLGQNLLIWLLFKTGKNLGSFDPDHYARMVSSNADFRKFDDGLKMTLDCDEATRTRIEALLDEARGRGKIRYGLFAQDEAMVTCIVPSALRDDHVHFIDGASGGYTQAAAKLSG